MKLLLLATNVKAFTLGHPNPPMQAFPHSGSNAISFPLGKGVPPLGYPLTAS